MATVARERGLCTAPRSRVSRGLPLASRVVFPTLRQMLLLRRQETGRFGVRTNKRWRNRAPALWARYTARHLGMDVRLRDRVAAYADSVRPTVGWASPGFVDTPNRTKSAIGVRSWGRSGGGDRSRRSFKAEAIRVVRGRGLRFAEGGIG